MGPFVLAWLVGEGIIVYRTVSRDHVPPGPGRLLSSSGLFVLLSLLAKGGPGPARAATLLAVGFDIAAYLQVPLTNAGATGTKTTAKGKTVTAGTFPAAGSAGSGQIFPDGGPGGAIDCTSSSDASVAADSTSSNFATDTNGATGGGGTTANQSAAVTVITGNPQFSGWNTGSNWTSLVHLWTRESSWDNTIANTQSGALGIAQALGHGNGSNTQGTLGNEYGGFGLTDAQAKQANSGNAAAQILWGLNYIKATYGSPAAAWAHETSAGWY